MWRCRAWLTLPMCYGCTTLRGPHPPYGLVDEQVVKFVDYKPYNVYEQTIYFRNNDNVRGWGVQRWWTASRWGTCHVQATI